ncbi:MAG: extracellular solute-binding protein [Spirochaetota bacterium]
MKYKTLHKVLTLSTLYVFLLLACSEKKSGEETAGGKPVLSMYIHGTTENANVESDLDKELEKMTGYKVKKTFLVADQATTSGILLASGDYADILNMREDTGKFIDAEVFIPLQDLIKEHAPRIYELYKPYWEQIKHADGNIYTIPEIYPFNPESPGVASMGMGIGLYMQKAVLEWAGYPAIKDIAQYFDILKSYKEEHPTIDGQKTIGFAFPAEGWRFLYTVYSPPFLAGYPNESGPLIDCIVNGGVDYTSNPCSGEWVPRDPFLANPEFKTTLSFYNQAYLNGLIPKDTIVQTHEQYNEKIASGRVLGVFDQGWEIGGAQEVLRKEKPNRVLYNLPVTLSEDIEVFVDVKTPNYGAGYGISVKASDPVAAIQYLDKSFSNEAILLMNWGLEGTDYLLDDNGRYYRTEEMRQKAYDKAYKESHWGNVLTWVAQGVFDNGNSVIPDGQPSEFFARLSNTDKELAQAYNVQSLSELYPAPSNRRLAFSPLWTFSFDKEKEKEYLKVNSARGEMVNEYTAKLIFAEAGEFESIWQEMNQKLSAIPNQEIYLQTWKAKLEKRIRDWK